MEKGLSRGLTSSFQELHLNNNNPKPTLSLPPGRTTNHHQQQRCNNSKEKLISPSLVTLCLQSLGEHLEDLIDDLREIAPAFTPEIKMVMLAIARRRKLLNDDILISLADDSWVILDVSGSEVSDVGLTEVLKVCESLKAVDISCCSRITKHGVSELLSSSHLLETLRCGGCSRSSAAVRKCLDILKPKLINVAAESWEELSVKEIASNAESLRWLVWPDIDQDAQKILARESPRIVVNPKPSLLGGPKVPKEAIVHTALDDTVVRDINPETWAVTRVVPRVLPSESNAPMELPKSEKFRLAFVERDERLAPKRAKNERQRQRRAQMAWMMSGVDTKSVLLAFEHGKFIRTRT